MQCTRYVLGNLPTAQPEVGTTEVSGVPTLPATADGVAVVAVRPI